MLKNRQQYASAGNNIQVLVGYPVSPAVTSKISHDRFTSDFYGRPLLIGV